MWRKINFLSVLLICMMTVSCKKEVALTDKNSNLTREESIATESLESTATFVKSEQPADGKYPEMTFVEKEFDFGDIKQGDKVDHTFNFKNTGEADLIITNAQASCGCTIPDYPKDTPIKPGESGKIKVTFNSAGKSGPTMKTITITCNTPSGNELLKIKTTINVPK